MNRDETKEICRRYYFKMLSKLDLANTITAYCLEKGKDPDKTRMLVTAVLTTPFVVTPMFTEAMEYFMKKYNIIVLTDMNDKVISVN